MKAHPVVFVCLGSQSIRMMITGVLVAPCIVLGLAQSIHNALSATAALASERIELSDAIHMAKLSLTAASAGKSTLANHASEDKAQVMQHLSLHIGQGLSSLEFKPVSQTQLKSIALENRLITVEYELPTIQAANQVTEALNGDAASRWTLIGLNAQVTTTGGQQYVARWQALLNSL